MTTALEQKVEKQTTLPPKELVIKLVLEKLGTPKNLSQVRATNVWGDNWRVSVLSKNETTAKGGSCIVIEEYTDSFFVTFSDGEIVASDPEIRRKYDG
jgi:hypothetical protein